MCAMAAPDTACPNSKLSQVRGAVSKTLTAVKSVLKNVSGLLPFVVKQIQQLACGVVTYTPPILTQDRSVWVGWRGRDLDAVRRVRTRGRLLACFGDH